MKSHEKHRIVLRFVTSPQVGQAGSGGMRHLATALTPPTPDSSPQAPSANPRQTVGALRPGLYLRHSWDERLKQGKTGENDLLDAIRVSTGSGLPFPTIGSRKPLREIGSAADDFAPADWR